MVARGVVFCLLRGCLLAGVDAVNYIIELADERSVHLALCLCLDDNSRVAWMRKNNEVVCVLAFSHFVRQSVEFVCPVCAR